MNRKYLYRLLFSLCVVTLSYPTVQAQDVIPDSLAHTQEIQQTLDHWMTAWLDQDPDAYLSIYAEDYQLPPVFDTRASWEQAQRQQLAASKISNPNIDSLKVVPQDDITSLAQFVLTFEANNRLVRADMAVLFKNYDNQWRILQENTSNLSTSPIASTAEEVVQQVEDELELDGLVLDETISKWGRDFYDLFYTQWQTLSGPALRNYQIVVTEQITASFNIWLRVQLNDTIIYNQRLNPRPDIVERAAGMAVAQVQQTLIQQSQDREEIGSDLAGDGIY